MTQYAQWQEAIPPSMPNQANVEFTEETLPLPTLPQFGFTAKQPIQMFCCYTTISNGFEELDPKIPKLFGAKRLIVSMIVSTQHSILSCKLVKPLRRYDSFSSIQCKLVQDEDELPDMVNKDFCTTRLVIKLLSAMEVSQPHSICGHKRVQRISVSRLHLVFLL